MRSAITVNYVPDGDDWTVTVTCGDQTRTATAAGVIAARDQADQLVEQLVPEPGARTVVHLLDGDGVAFTTSYLHARLGLEPADPPPAAIPQPATGEAGDRPAAPASVAPASVASTSGAAASAAPASVASAAEDGAQAGTLPVEQPSAS